MALEIDNSIVSINLRNRDGSSPSYFKVFTRNILRSISRILLFIPFIIMIFSENNQTIIKVNILFKMEVKNLTIKLNNANKEAYIYYKLKLIY